MRFTIVVQPVTLPAIIVHGGAGAYLKTTSAEQRRQRGASLLDAARTGHAQFAQAGGGRSAMMAAIEHMELAPQFNAGFGSRLQQDGVARLSAAVMDGSQTRLSAVYNVRDCTHPSRLADALQKRPDRNLDGDGAQLLMRDLGIRADDVRSAESIERWRKLIAVGDQADREAAIGSAGEEALDKARAARIPVPRELDLPAKTDRYGTIGAIACAPDEAPWACTSTGGRGHEAVGRLSDSPTPAGNYACPIVGLSATGFGEQILDLNLCGRVATRMLDGANLEQALRRTFEEVCAADGLLGIIGLTADGMIGYAHSTEACGVAWVDGSGAVHVDQHGRS